MCRYGEHRSERLPGGQTALIAKVPDAEPLVSSWRRQFDTAAAAGVPAHVTVLSQPGGRPSRCSVRPR
jgi:hypothetical protein